MRYLIEQNIIFRFLNLSFISKSIKNELSKLIRDIIIKYGNLLLKFQLDFTISECGQHFAVPSAVLHCVATANRCRLQIPTPLFTIQSIVGRNKSIFYMEVQLSLGLHLYLGLYYSHYIKC